MTTDFVDRPSSCASRDADRASGQLDPLRGTHMGIDEIRRRARGLRWTRAQALFLSDRIRNALVVLGSPAVPQTNRASAARKLLSAIEAIEDAARRQPASVGIAPRRRRARALGPPRR
jgi:hypothetical protein